MEQKTGNTFGGGMKKDISDFVLKDNQLRFGHNIRVINQEGTNYVVSNITGTEQAFTITSGFVPVGSAERNNVLYLILWNNTTKEIEVGSYPSPDYGDAQPNNKYRPFNNLNDGPFRTDSFAIATQPTVDVQIQDDYDRSVNVVFTIKGSMPRIVNSRFKVDVDINGNHTYTDLASTPRPGTANSNSYTTSSVEKETRLIVSSDTVLEIDLIGVQTGGKLKPGNYIYVFQYMTEDFNTTAISGQSSVCQIFMGSDVNTIRGGDETQETDKRVVLSLSNVDTDFKFLKVYCLYSSGQDGLLQQYLEFTAPISITGENMTFVHTGYEELAQISQDSLNIDYGNLSSVDTITQINGYLLLGGIKEFSYDLTPFRQFAQGIVPRLKMKTLSPTGVGAYGNPSNTYNYLGYFGRESYPFAIVFILPGGALSPAFPIKGTIINAVDNGASYTVSYSNPIHPENGIVTFPPSNIITPYDSDLVQVKSLEMLTSDFSLTSNGVSQPVIDFVKENTLGFFFVRGERRESLLTQGVLIPTFKAPTIEYNETSDAGDNTYWMVNRTQIDNTSFFKHLPSLDSLIEAHNNISRGDGSSAGQGSYDYEVVDSQNRVQDGYMPSFINDWVTQGGNTKEIWYSKQGETWQRHWALISGEALLNEPAYTSFLQRQGISIQQLAKVQHRVKGEVLPKLTMYDGNPLNRTGLWYDFESFTRYVSTIIKTVASIDYVPGETFLTGNNFISKINTVLYNGTHNSDEFFNSVDMVYNSFFGVEMATTSVGQLTDSSKGINNPVGGNARITSYGSLINAGQTSGPNYNNLGKLVPASFLVNVYPSGGPELGSSLYNTIDNIAYKQITKRFTWVNAPSPVPVFGGDCYIGKIYHKLNQSRYRNPIELISDIERRSNIDAGIMLSWYQESKYNMSLRQAKRFDSSELVDRSFFPYEGKGDFIKFRSYRYPESLFHSKGYSEVLPPKSSFVIPVNTPFLENEFFSRVYASDKHVPNAFRNGFRRITSNFKDYTSSLGRIVRLFNHRGKMMIVFENGIGVGEIEQRVQTGSDVAGSIFVLVKEILPPTLGYPTQEIGSQYFYSMVQTPSAIYGYDGVRRKIWQLRDTLEVITDDGFSSFLDKNPVYNLRSGYDPQNNEVVFTTDNWTLCFREGQEAFNSFYSFKPSYYSRRGSEFYSFPGDVFHKHNIPDVYTIYGQERESIVEFVVNEKLNITKVLDSIEIISNEVAPTKVEIFTYNQTSEKIQTLVTSSMNQYVRILNETNPYTLAPRIGYKNKSYKLAVPLIQIYNGGEASDRWGIKGRMSNIYFIIRLTYQSNNLLQLASVVSSYRYSAS